MGDGGVVGGTGDDDAAAFSRLVARYRPELQVHCYRLLGSFEESGRLVTETLARAWRERESFAGHPTFRTWLYRVATRACLDFLAAAPRAPLPREVRGGGPVPATALPWLQPCPDTLLEQVPAQRTGSDEVAAKETISLAFMVALQLLPPRQRAVFVLREVLEWPARETAAALGVSVAAVNSALQRARRSVRKHLPRAAEPEATEYDDCAVLRLYTDALERGDTAALATVLCEAPRTARRPDPPHCRRLPTRMNHQPAVARYARGPGERVHRAHGLEVLRVEGGRIAEITEFAPGLFPALGLPLAL
ncbi:sigma-70 family RNA polymerase sigma factor [Streptomyces albofaciens JCM 4342]|uniref:RNA polymerase subunit sigma-70 n=1 Tax=Streptomyces albofaciens TaxID=66866 RepID=UPI00123B06A6|nr:RNA polymerase subunit sigma-70 [Streptomyces albofaciens]KAA6212956.1 sigma-70 family RNA polymerase sigma factor [Streptomyces albofaciens JCM 4342]